MLLQDGRVAVLSVEHKCPYVTDRALPVNLGDPYLLEDPDTTLKNP